MKRLSLKITPSQAGLIVVDVQERLLPAMHEKDILLRHALQLVRGSAVIDLPIFATEQYRKGLGPTAAELAAAIPVFSPFEKQAFSCCGAPGFVSHLTSQKITEVILCGIETHVCVCQTALDLLDQGFGVFVVADATSSRTSQNRSLGLERMRHAGAVIVSVEMILFELLGQAGDEKFKRILEIIK